MLSLHARDLCDCVDPTARDTAGKCVSRVQKDVRYFPHVWAIAGRRTGAKSRCMMIMTTIDATPPSAITLRGRQERVRRKRGGRVHEILDETCIMGGRLLSYLTSDGNRFAPTPSFALGRGSAHSRVTGIELDFLSRCYTLL